MHKLVVSIEPVAKQRARVLKTGRSYTPSKTKNYEDTLKGLFIVFARKHNIKPSGNPICLWVEFYLSRPKTNKSKLPIVRPDLDNYLKSVMDAGNGVFWIDDSCVVKVIAEKRYADYVCASIAIKIEEML